MESVCEGPDLLNVYYLALQLPQGLSHLLPLHLSPSAASDCIVSRLLHCEGPPWGSSSLWRSVYIFLGVLPVDETIPISYIEHFILLQTFVTITLLCLHPACGVGLAVGSTGGRDS